MARGFNLTAEINLRGPANIRQVVSNIRRQLGTISADVNININSNVTRNVNSLNTRLGALNATLNQTAASATNAATAFNNLASAMASVGSVRLPTNIAAPVANITNNVTAANRAIAQTRTEFEDFGRQAGLAVRRFAAFASVTSVIYGVNSAIAAGIKQYIEFDRQLTRLSQVTQVSKNGLSDITSEITRLSTSMGVVSNDLAQVSVTLAQAGFSARDTKIALEALAKTTLAPSFDNLNQTVEGSIALMRQFGISSKELEAALGSVNAVAAGFAVESSDLIAAIQRTGGVFASASRGVSEGTDSLNEFLAVFTSVRATTRESAETIATGLRTIFTRIQRADTIDALKEYGVELTDLEGKFVGPYEAVRRLSEGLSSLDNRDLKFSSIVEELGGFRQIGKVLPLIQQFATAQQALKVAQEGQGSLASDAVTGQQALAVQIQKVREEFSALMRSFGDSDSFKTMVRLGLDLASALIKIADATKGLLPLVGIMAAFRGVSAITQFAGGFGSGLGGGGARRRSMGGPIYGFASGGVVPGSGRGDKVPALLEPGEVVMSNSAGNKYGRGNLVKMNKYASGGLSSLQKLSPGMKGKTNIEEAITSYNRLQDEDIVSNKIIRTQLSKKDIEKIAGGSQPFKDTLNKGRQNKYSDKFYQSGLGFAFEDWVLQNLRSIGLSGKYKKARTNNYPVDLISEGNAAPVEIKYKNDTEPDPFILNKHFRYLLDTNKWKSRRFTKNIDTKPPVDIGNIRVVELADGTKDELYYPNGVSQKTIETRKKRAEKRIAPFYADQEKNTGGLIQRFAEGGVAQRKLGYIDYDVIANPANETIVKKGMEETGVTGPRLYADKLTELAVAARKNQSISKLRAIYGVAGSGKTTLARGSGTDDATLRKTERFPILSPQDIDRATEITLLSSSVSQKKLDELFSATDRTYTLSSTTKAERDRVRSQRDSRDVTGVGLEGRVPGSTRGVSTDTAVGEALLSDRLGSKSVVLGRSESGRLRRKKDNELVEIVKKKIGVTWGGFAPMTAGHESILDAASAMGYSPEDFLFLVGANEGIKLGDPSSYRTAVFNQDARVLLAKAGAGARGATVLPKAADFEVPIGFDISEAGSDRRKVLLPGSGSRAFVADKTPEQMAKYKASGYQVTNLERTGGISATMVRDLIMGGNMAELQKVLSPGVYELISNNIGRIQNRANALPEIVESVKSNEATKLRDIEKQIKAVGISRIDKKKLADPEYAAKAQVLEELREQRDKIKRASAFEPYKLLDDLAKKYPDKYALDFGSYSPATPSPVRTASSRTQKANLGGMIRKFADAGAVSSTGGKRASRSEILKTLGSIEAAEIAGVQPTEIYQLLGLRNPNMAQQAKIEAVEKEYIKKINRKKGASQGVLTRLENQGLSFAAAGMLGSPFKEQTYDAVGSTGTRKVKLVAGVMDKALANELDAMFRQDTDPIAAKAAEKALIFDVLKRFGDGRQLYLDFDNTLATGADAMDLKDFRDPNKVSEALATAKPTRLATELRALTQQRPELLSSMSVITARPPSTLDIIQKWLAQQGLPIPRSQFTGVGGDANIVSLSDIPGLKAALLKPDSLFVDDDNQNIRAAIKRGGVESYKYGGDSILPNENTESSIQGGLLEKMVQKLGGPGAQKGLGFDFPQGLQGAAKYFGLPEDIPTDLKRTISGPSTIKDNITTYLKAMGFKDGGEAKAKKPKTTFGSGEFPFPKRISNAYSKEIDKILEAQRIEKVWESRPKNERMPIDEQTIQKEFEAPFNKEMFLASFKDAISRNTLYKRISEFARFVGLPEEDLSVALPSHIDFGGPSSVLGAPAQFDRTGIGTRRLEGVDLSQHGFSEADKQDLFGYSKLIEEKQKAVKKVLKTPVRTFDDGSFHYDDVAARSLWQEINELKTKRMAKSSLNNDAINQARTSIMDTAAQTGRGAVSINRNPFGASKYEMLYHELTHQLINGLRTRQQDSFTKYKERIVSLFENDNDGLAEAFDALGGYNSADVVYGRSYKVNAIRDMLFSRSRQTTQRAQDPGQQDYFDQLNSSFSEANTQKTAKQFKPINPDVNRLLLSHPTTQVSQEVINRMEDSGKEEFLTTLLEKAPVLDENLSSILDSTLSDLLGSAGIKRQKFAAGGSVPALVSNGEAYVPPKLAKRIGYGKLSQMNRADKNGTGRFSEGGISIFKGPGSGTSDSISTNLPVGSFILREKATKALGFSRGGNVGVQRFLFGGPPSARPTDPTFQTVGIDAQVIGIVQGLSEVLTQLGVSSAQTTKLLASAKQQTYSAMIQAIESDIRRAKIAGASADQIREAEERLKQVRDVAERDIKTRNQLKNATGSQLQQIDSKVDAKASRLEAAQIQRLLARNPGMTRDQATDEVAKDRQKYRDLAYQSTARDAGLNVTGLKGQDIQRFISQMMRDRKTLEQMDKELIKIKQQEVMSTREYAAASKAEQKKMLKDAKRDAEEEANERNNVVNEKAKNEGASAPRGSNERSNLGFMIGVGVITVGNLVADNIDIKNSASNAALAAGIRSGSQVYGTGQTVTGELSNLASSASGSSVAFVRVTGSVLKFGAKAALVATVVATLASVIKDGYNAYKQFYIDLEQNRIDGSLKRIEMEFDRLSKSINEFDLSTINSELNRAATSFSNTIQLMQNKGLVQWSNMFDAFRAIIIPSLKDIPLVGNLLDQFVGGSTMPLDQFNRLALVLERAGQEAYNRASSSEAQLRSETDTIIPQLAIEQAGLGKPIADAISRTLSERFKRGETSSDIFSDVNFDNIANTIANADVAIREAILRLENSGLNNAEIAKRSKNLIEQAAKEKIIQEELLSVREREARSAERFGQVYTRSLSRSFENMNQSVNAVIFGLEQLKETVDLSAKSFSGQAQAGQVRLNSSNIINNPRAYSDAQVSEARTTTASLFGSRADIMSPLLGSAEAAQATIMSTINDTLQSNIGATNEVILRNISSNLKQTFRDLGLPPELADKMAREVGTAVAKIRQSGDEDISFADLQEKVASLGSVLDITKDALATANKALDAYRDVLNSYVSYTNQLIDLELSKREKLNRSIDILIDANTSLSSTLGKTIDLENTRIRLQRKVSRTSGGANDPGAIFQEILKLEQQRRVAQSSQNNAADRGPQRIDDFVKFNNEIRNSSIQLRENYNALKLLAENTEYASAAMSRIQELQNRIGGRVSFIEKLVTSSPDELEALNNAMRRLQNNMNGQQNTIQNSVGAQRAYAEALNQGANAAQAMKAAQNAFANERKETLAVLQDMLPFLGEGQDASNIRANVLENMLRESGMGVSPMMQQVLNSLRNPQNDPALAAAIRHYEEANNLQSEANRLLAKLDAELAKDIALAQSDALLNGMKNLTFRFENQELKDILNSINKLVPIEAAPKSQGGVIYAAAGQMINFKSKGTDTVPAMLTPGEFVVNRQATQANLPLLHSINNGYSSGGRVSYYARGGYVAGWGEKVAQADTNVSKNEIIDLTDANSRIALESGFGQLYKAPSSYTLSNVGGQAPISTKGSETNVNLNSLANNAGANVVPGFSSAFIVERNTIKAAPKQNDARQAFFNTEFKDKNEFFYPNENLDSIETKKIKIQEYDTWKAEAKKLDIWDSIVPKKNIDFTDFATDAPKASRFTATANEFYPTVLAPSLGIYKSASPVAAQELESGYGFFTSGRIGAVASRGGPAFDSDHPWNSVSWTNQRPHWPLGYAANQTADLTGSKIVAAANATDKMHKYYSDAAKLYDDPKAVFEEGDLSDSMGSFQQKLTNLYKGNKISEEFTPKEVTDYLTHFSDKTGIIGDATLRVFDKSAIPELDILAKNYVDNTNDFMKEKKIKFGFINPINGRPDIDWITNTAFDIDTNPTSAIKQFPWVTNIGLNDLTAKLQDDILKGVGVGNPGNIKMSARTETFKKLLGGVNGLIPALTLAALSDIEIPIAYAHEEWQGKLYNTASDSFVNPIKNYILPNSINDTIFSGLDISTFRPIDDPKNSWKLKSSDNFKSINDYLTALYNDKNDPNLGNLKNAVDAKVEFINNRRRNPNGKIFNGVDVLSDRLDATPRSVDVKDYLLPKIAKAIESRGVDAGKASPDFRDVTSKYIDDSELAEVVRNTAKGALQIFGRRRLPGFSNGWLASYIGKIPRMKNMNVDYAKQVSAYTADVFSGAGGVVDNLINSNNFNPQTKNYLQDTWTLLAGGFNVFSGLASGNTTYMTQLRDMGADVETLFRGAGLNIAFGRLSGTKLNNNWKAILIKALENGKMKTPGGGGTLSEKEMLDKMPDDVQGLVDLIFNPYNEFDKRSTRSSLIDQFISDLSMSRGSDPRINQNRNSPRNLLIDPNTMNWIRERTNILKQWYGGDFPWLGQDYLYDKNLEPDNATRASNFATDFDANGKFLYPETDRAHTELGFAQKFGPIPDMRYFNARIAQGFQTGGVVYAENGGQMVNFQPRGTDTVPAMLTPGEFVINRQATKKHLPLLKSINSGSQAYSSGGVVYAQDGGMINNDTKNEKETVASIFVGAKPDQSAQERFFKELEMEQKRKSRLITTDNTITGRRTRIDPDTFEVMEDSFIQPQTQFDLSPEKLLDNVIESSSKINLDNLSTALDTLGLIPVVGNLADIANVGVNLLRGDIPGAGLSALAAIPGIGLGAGATKIGRNAAKLARINLEGAQAISTLKKIDLATNASILAVPVASEIYDQYQEELDNTGEYTIAASGSLGAWNKAHKTPLSQRMKRIFNSMPPKWAWIGSLGAAGLAAATLVRSAQNKRANQNSASPVTPLGSGTAATPRITDIPTILTPEESARRMAEIAKDNEIARELSERLNEVRSRTPPYLRQKFNTTVEDSMDEFKPGGGDYELVSGSDGEPDVYQWAINKLREKKDADLELVTDVDGQMKKAKGSELDTIYKDKFDYEKWKDRTVDAFISAVNSILDTNTAYYAQGGMVYANNGMLVPYQPRGTDTVPAMLTPGEFVVNRAATQKNLPLLKAINGGFSEPLAYSQGGTVYLQNGGLTPKEKQQRFAISRIDPKKRSTEQQTRYDELQRKWLDSLSPEQREARDKATAGAKKFAETQAKQYQDDAAWKATGYSGDPVRARLKLDNPDASAADIENMVADAKGAELAKKLGWEITDSQISRSSEIYAPAGGVVGSYTGYEKGEEPDLSKKLTPEEIKLWSEYQDRQRLEMARKEREAADVTVKQEREGLKTKVAQIREKEAKQAIKAGIVKPSDLGMQTQDDFSQARKLTAMELAKLRQKEIDDRFAEKATQRQAQDDRAQASIDQIKQNQQDRANRDARAAQEINPRTGVAYKDDAEKAGVEAFMAAEQARKQKQQEKDKKNQTFAEAAASRRQTKEKLQMYIEARRTDIKTQKRLAAGSKEDSLGTGIFSALKTTITGSDPTSELIKDARVDIARAENTLKTLNEETKPNELGRQTKSLEELQASTQKAKDGYSFLLRSHSMGNANELRDQMMQNEHEAINLTRDIITDVATSAIPGGVALKGIKGAAKVAQGVRLGVKSGALTGAIMSGVRSTDANYDVAQREWRRDPAAENKDGRVRDITDAEGLSGILSGVAIGGSSGALGGALFGGLMPSAGLAASSMLGAGRRGASWLAGAGGKGASWLGKAFSRGTSGLRDAVSDGVSGLGAAVSRGASNLGGAIGKGVSGLSRATSGRFDGLGGAVSRGASWLAETASKGASSLGGAIGKGVGGFGEVVGAGASRAKNFANDLLKRSRQAFTRSGRTTPKTNTPDSVPPQSPPPKAQLDPSAPFVPLDKDAAISELSKRETDIYKLFGGQAGQPISAGSIREATRRYSKFLHPDLNPGIDKGLQSKFNNLSKLAEDQEALDILNKLLARGFLDKATGKTYRVDASDILEAYKGGGKFSSISLKASALAKEAASYKKSGGMIYASQGKLVPYQPKGTDTVPAMLTPGEFVVNAKATQNNLPLLRAINSGSYSSGGVVYLQNGGTDKDDFRLRFTGASNASDRKKQAEQQKKQRQDQYNYQQMMNRFITPIGQALVAEILAKPDIFDIFNDEFLKEKAQAGDLLAKYKEKYDKIKATKPDELFSIAQADYARDDQRFKYLQMIATNNQAALSQAGTDLRKIITVPGKKEHTLLEVIKRQIDGATNEGYAYLEGWKQVHAAYPELKQQTAQQQYGVPASAFNRGGVVYANNGMLIPYQPKGTDTVPAMLTPGEFVVNRKASQDNLSLLHAINSGHYSGGGPVQYLSGGTPGQSGSGFMSFFQGLGDASKALIQFSSGLTQINPGPGLSEFYQGLGATTQILTRFGNILSQLTNGVNNNAPAAQGGGAVPGIDLSGLNNFTQKFEAFTQQLAAINIPPEINVNLVQNKAWEININGAEVFAALDGKIQEIVNSAIARLNVGQKEQQQ